MDIRNRRCCVPSFSVLLLWFSQGGGGGFVSHLLSKQPWVA